MSPKEFDITIETDGTVEVHAQGFKGRGCLDALKVFEEALGEIKSRRLTSEYYEPDEEVTFRLEQRR